MGDLERALADISEIRSQIARGTAFHGYGAATLAATGAFAAAAGMVQGHWLADAAQKPLAYVGLWTATAAVSVIFIGVETFRRTHRAHAGMAQEMLLNAMEQFLPAGVAGVLLTAVLLRFTPEGQTRFVEYLQVLEQVVRDAAEASRGAPFAARPAKA